jgi:exopolysaccharide production protein ExoQ
MGIAGPLTSAPDAKRTVPSSRRQLSLTWWLSLIALSALMFTQFSQTNAVIVFMAAVIICGIARPYEAFTAVLNSKILWPFLLYAALSITWSPIPDWTARGVVQLIFTAGAAVILAQALSPKSFITVVIGSCMIATVASIIYLGPALIGQLSSGFPVQGIFLGSKNTFGYVEVLLILAGFCFVLDATRRPITRLSTVLGICLAAILLIGSRSATAVGALAPALICSSAAYFLIKFSPRWRAIILVSVFAMSVLFAAMAIPVAESAFSFFLDVSGKDATLTGRTLLWQWADRIIAEQPILGSGYQAFWFEGNAYAIEIWREQGLDWRPGLNFHNQWYEMTVQLGYVGLVFTLVPFLIVLIDVARWAVRVPSPESCFFLGFMVYTTVSTYVEVELFSQYSIPFTIFIAAYVYARRNRRAQATPRATIGRRHAPRGV